jgi:hypothetical protein
MRGYGICYQLPDGTPELLDRALARIEGCGYTHAGIGAALTWDIILAGTVDRERLAPFLEVIEGYRSRLRFYVHGPVFNLFDLGAPTMHERTLDAAVEIMELVGAEIMAIHPPERQPWPQGAPVHMSELLAREREGRPGRAVGRPGRHREHVARPRGLLLRRLAGAAGRAGGSDRPPGDRHLHRHRAPLPRRVLVRL